MPEPADPTLYRTIQRAVYARVPRHSAYRSGLVVREYKRAFQQLHPGRDPYIGPRRGGEGLARWFAERWRNQRGRVGYQYPSDVYRPTRRVNASTPVTFAELSPARLRAARREKAKTGRVVRF